MFEDCATATGLGGSTLRTTLCIVGAGPAGISLALQFIGTDTDVVLVAGGGLDHDDRAQALYAGEVADQAMHSPLTEYRHRQFGGSSATWGGRCMPFDPIDFEERPWIDGARWPIRHEDIARFYPAASALAEIGDPVFDAREAVPGGMRAMAKGFVPQAFDLDRLERFSAPTNFGRRYGERLRRAPNIRVLLNAHVVEIRRDRASPRIGSLRLRTLEGAEFAVLAERFVIATGGIETARLLLASRRDDPNGIGNARDLVGRNYLCHIAGTMGRLSFTRPANEIFHGYERAWDGTYCRRRMALRPEVQREKGIANIVLRLHHPRLPDPAHGRGILSAIFLAKPFISYEYSKRLHGGDAMSASLALRHAWNVVREPFGTAGFLMDWARRRTLAARKFPSLIVAPRNNSYSLDIHAEQVPNPESRITLAASLDAFGQPQARVDWRYRPLDLETVRVALHVLKDELAQWGGGALAFDEAEIPDAMLREGAYGGHHIGTARMGRSPEEGVVDADGKVFGTDNLYLAGSATFPTSSQANPTLTIVASALRLAEHLQRRRENPAIETEQAA
ncbi:MAG: FAD-dependent oxidoreductase [Methylobacterium sp.]|nr:MAG: FAD-dependent oxidoreductase [Methylobacterium sp.]